MPARRVEFHPDAVVEAQAAKAWYENRNTIAADAFVDELDHAVAQIAEAPNRWPRYIAGTRRYLLSHSRSYTGNLGQRSRLWQWLTAAGSQVTGGSGRHSQGHPQTFGKVIIDSGHSQKVHGSDLARSRSPAFGLLAVWNIASPLTMCAANRVYFLTTLYALIRSPRSV